MSEDLPVRVRLAAASAGALLTAVVVTPFDVVKTRMQMQSESAPGNGTSTCSSSGHSSTSPGSTVTRPVTSVWQSRSFHYSCQPPTAPLSPDAGQLGELAACPRCGVFVLNNGLMEHMLSKTECSGWLARPAMGAASGETAGATLAVLSRIARTEGASGLYAGLGPTLAMAVPNTALYFAAYDELRRLEVFPASVAPGLSGASARVVAATAVAPFELARTQLQALPAGARGDYGAQLWRLVRTEGLVSTLFRGLGPTLWRDVPFSAVYWATLETVKSLLARRRRPPVGQHLASETGEPIVQRLTTAGVAGLAAGAVAAAVTTPFDVVKTRRMVETHTGTPAAPPGAPANASTIHLAAAIARAEGPAALFAGAVPRLLKVAPACAIMIATYETAKGLFLRHSLSTDRGKHRSP